MPRMDDPAATPKPIRNFGDIAFTPSVKAVQSQQGARNAYARLEGVERRIRFSPEEMEFIAERDAFYLATVGENGWPYVQFRGGSKGFLRVLNEQTLGFADFRGNRQYISTGNLTATHHACLFLMDYPNQARLKIWADAEISQDEALIERLRMPDDASVVERAILFRVAAFDWNCDQHIPRRYTPEEYARFFGEITPPGF